MKAGTTRTRVTDEPRRPIFIIRLRVLPGRGDGLRALAVREERAAP